MWMPPRPVAGLLVVGAALGPPLLVAYVRPAPSAEQVTTLARQAWVRQASEAPGAPPGDPERLQRVSDRVVAGPDAAVKVHSRCVVFAFAWFQPGEWYYDVELAPTEGAPTRFWMEIDTLPVAPALIQARALRPAPGCLSR